MIAIDVWANWGVVGELEMASEEETIVSVLGESKELNEVSLRSFGRCGKPRRPGTPTAAHGPLSPSFCHHFTIYVSGTHCFTKSHQGQDGPDWPAGKVQTGLVQA